MIYFKLDLTSRALRGETGRYSVAWFNEFKDFVLTLHKQFDHRQRNVRVNYIRDHF